MVFGAMVKDGMVKGAMVKGAMVKGVVARGVVMMVFMMGGGMGMCIGHGHLRGLSCPLATRGDRRPTEAWMSVSTMVDDRAAVKAALDVPRGYLHLRPSDAEQPVGRRARHLPNQGGCRGQQ